MNPGDLVRFRHKEDNLTSVSLDRVWKLGLLIKHCEARKIATILFNDKLLSLPVCDVQKFGRRYLGEKR